MSSHYEPFDSPQWCQAYCGPSNRVAYICYPYIHEALGWVVFLQGQLQLWFHNVRRRDWDSPEEIVSSWRCSYPHTTNETDLFSGTIDPLPFCLYFLPKSARHLFQRNIRNFSHLPYQNKFTFIQPREDQAGSIRFFQKGHLGLQDGQDHRQVQKIECFSRNIFTQSWAVNQETRRRRILRYGRWRSWSNDLKLLGAMEHLWYRWSFVGFPFCKLMQLYWLFTNSTKRSSLTYSEDVGRRIWYSIEYQVSCEQTVGPFSHHFYSATFEVV